MVKLATLMGAKYRLKQRRKRRTHRTGHEGAHDAFAREWLRRARARNGAVPIMVRDAVDAAYIKHDDEGGSQSSAAPAKKSTSSNGLEPLDRKKLKKNVLRIVREGDIETLTSKMVRKQLEAVFGFELKPHKEQIEEACLAAIEKVREEQAEALEHWRPQPNSSVPAMRVKEEEAETTSRCSRPT